MSDMPLVSVIITTKNEEKVLEGLLLSLKQQAYSHTELIIVDNNSGDATKQIALSYTSKVFNKGPERSTQRNYGAKKAQGTYYLFLDADMTLSDSVITECIKLVQSQKKIKAVVIPEKSIGTGFWSQCKALERQCYVGDVTLEAARFFEKKVFWKMGGYDETITGPEDWDLPQKISRQYRIGRIKSLIYHHEGRITLARLAQKKYYYGQKVAPYIAKHPLTTTTQQVVYLLRPALYRNWKLLVKKPLFALGMVIMLSVEQLAGFWGFLCGKKRLCKKVM